MNGTDATIAVLPEGSVARPAIAEALPSGFQVNTTFVPDAGKGTYEFRASLRNPTFGSAAYSAPFAITVS